MTVFVYVNTSKQVGDPEHVKVLHAAETWFEENDPEGVAFEYEVEAAPTEAALLCPVHHHLFDLVSQLSEMDGEALVSSCFCESVALLAICSA